MNPGDATLAVDDLPVATLVVDAERVVTAANRLVGTLLARDPASLVGCSLTSLIVPMAEGVERKPWATAWHPSASLPSTRGIPCLLYTSDAADE